MEEPEIIEGGGLWGGRLIVFNSLPSTNRWAMDSTGCLHGDVVRAIRQTAGCGRFDRTWLSPGDRNLTASMVLRADSLDERILLGITQIAAIAIRDLLQKHSLEALLKWPNDVLVGGRKIAGILAERDAQSGDVVLGTGLNVSLSGDDLTDHELMQPATSMAIETGLSFDVADLSNGLIATLEASVGSAQRDPSAIHRTWSTCDALAAGAEIEIAGPGGIRRGKYAGLGPDGRLRLVEDGKEHSFLSGDVCF